MRLTLRFLALFLLLAMATFPNLRSMTAMADDTGIVIEEEQTNPCFEGCVRGYEGCVDKCGWNQDCQRKCREDRDKCEAKCR